MNKYNEIDSITQKYLSGTLEKFTMQYVAPEILKVSIIYKDLHDYTYSYNLEINSKNYDTSFLSHLGKTNMFKVSLDQDADFDSAICDFLCKK